MNDALDDARLTAKRKEISDWLCSDSLDIISRYFYSENTIQLEGARCRLAELGSQNIGKVRRNAKSDADIRGENKQAGNLGPNDILERDFKDEIWRLKKTQHVGHKHNESGLNEFINFDPVDAKEGPIINGLTASLSAEKSPRRTQTGTEEAETAGKVTELSGRESDNGTGGMTKLKPEKRTLGNADEKFAKYIKGNGNKMRNNKQPFQLSAKPKCPLKPRGLRERVPVDITMRKENVLSVQNGGTVQSGGFWKPKHCHPVAKVAILIAYRKRPEQLKVFLNHMHPVLQRQMLEYRMFVAEQAGNITFNRGAIYNIGFNKTLIYDDYDCYIFHDVDLLSENDFNSYACPESPRHMSVEVDKFGYKLPYAEVFGGIEAFKKKDFQAINGFSNKFWGWGGEDDNLFQRVKAKNMTITRPRANIGRYKMNMLHHYIRDKYNHQNALRVARSKKIGVLKTMFTDGLNSIHTLGVDVYVENFPLYTNISINLDKFKPSLSDL